MLSRVPGRRRSLHSVESQRFHLPHYALASARDAPREDRAAIWARLATEHVDDLSGSSRNLGLPACCSANRSADKCLVEGLMRDFGVERKPLHSPKGADVDSLTLEQAVRLVDANAGVDAVEKKAGTKGRVAAKGKAKPAAREGECSDASKPGDDLGHGKVTAVLQQRTEMCVLEPMLHRPPI